MKRVISKKDNKVYYLAVAKDSGCIGFLKGSIYQVRKATKSDCFDFQDYCVVNGKFYCLDENIMRTYHVFCENGTARYFNVLIPKVVCKACLDYVM